jgi:transcriptional regulator with XRE-family HTH domain
LVRTSRALLDWTQPDLAKAAGIALATLKRFEKDYRVPTDQTLAKIINVLKKAGVEFHHDGKRLVSVLVFVSWRMRILESRRKIFQNGKLFPSVLGLQIENEDAAFATFKRTAKVNGQGKFT